MSFAAITLCVASQRVVSKVSLYFVIDSVRKRLDTPSYFKMNLRETGFEGVDWNSLSEDRVYWWISMNTMMGLQGIP